MTDKAVTRWTALTGYWKLSQEGQRKSSSRRTLQTINLPAALVYTASLTSWLGGVQARTLRTLENQALDCIDHKHGPNRKLDQIPVENPVSITGGSGSYPDR